MVGGHSHPRTQKNSGGHWRRVGSHCSKILRHETDPVAIAEATQSRAPASDTACAPGTGSEPRARRAFLSLCWASKGRPAWQVWVPPALSKSHRSSLQPCDGRCAVMPVTHVSPDFFAALRRMPPDMQRVVDGMISTPKAVQMTKHYYSGFGAPDMLHAYKTVQSSNLKAEGKGRLAADVCLQVCCCNGASHCHRRFGQQARHRAEHRVTQTIL